MEKIMPNKSFTVPNISCMHCVHTIKTELTELYGVVSVTADQQSQTVSVEWTEPQTWEGIKELLVEINYPPRE